MASMARTIQIKVAPNCTSYVQIDHILPTGISSMGIVLCHFLRSYACSTEYHGLESK